MKKYLFSLLLCLCFGASHLCAQNANTAISADYPKAVSTFCQNFHMTDLITKGMLESIREEGLNLTAAQEKAMVDEMAAVARPYVEKELTTAFHSKFTLQELNEINHFFTTSVGQLYFNSILKSVNGQKNAVNEMMDNLTDAQKVTLVEFCNSGAGTKFYSSLGEVFNCLEHLQENSDLLTELTGIILKYL